MTLPWNTVGREGVHSMSKRKKKYLIWGEVATWPALLGKCLDAMWEIYKYFCLYVGKYKSHKLLFIIQRNIKTQLGGPRRIFKFLSFLLWQIRCFCLCYLGTSLENSIQSTIYHNDFYKPDVTVSLSTLSQSQLCPLKSISYPSCV